MELALEDLFKEVETVLHLYYPAHSTCAYSS